MLSLSKIKRLRKLSRFTQEECGTAIGIGRAEFCKKEAGDAPFSVDQIVKLADFLNVHVTELFDSGQAKTQEQMQMEFGMIDSLKGQIEALKNVIEMLKEQNEALRASKEDLLKGLSLRK